jgi:NADH-quinone oxidoreductase subunit G/[NiFe] hydrogenase diaphorase moiety small subunit
MAERAEAPDRRIGALVRARIDGVEVRVPLRTTILEAARLAGVRIPTLCHHPELGLGGNCRVCLVEVAGQDAFQAACAYPITAPVEVRTHTPELVRTRRRVVDLLLARHDGDCTVCPRNGDCELRRLAAEVGLDGPLVDRPAHPRQPVDRSRWTLIRDPGRCVACRRCIRTCADLQGVGVFEVLGRGEQVRVSTFADRPLDETDCIDCGQCVVRCPTAALVAGDTAGPVRRALEDRTRQVAIAVPPSAGIVLGDETGTLPEALRRLGFTATLDLGTATDLAALQLAAELLERLHDSLAGGAPAAPGPLLTSCCPAWIAFARRHFPDLLPNLSRVPHPLRLLAAVRPAGVGSPALADAVAAIVPCAALLRELLPPDGAGRGPGGPDLALTTRDLARMLADAGLEPGALPGAARSPAMGHGALRDVTGGVTESLLRTLLGTIRGAPVGQLWADAEILPVRGLDGIRYAEFPVDRVGPVPSPFDRRFADFAWLEGTTLRIGICHGTQNARRVMEDVRAGGRFAKAHLIEVMACPGGCVGGGGHPGPAGPAVLAARAGSLFAADRTAPVRTAHENTAALAILAAKWYGANP